MSHPTTAAKAVRRYQTGDVITVFVTARPEFEGHTPGPWIIQAHGEFTPARVIAPHGTGNGCPCEVVSGCDPADAALLAAAPALLAERDALRAQVAELAGAMGKQLRQCPCEEASCVHCAPLAAALAKVVRQ